MAKAEVQWLQRNGLTRLAKTVLTLFSTRVKVSPYVYPFIELATVSDATGTPQINSCMITSKRVLHLFTYTLEKLMKPLLRHSFD